MGCVWFYYSVAVAPPLYVSISGSASVWPLVSSEFSLSTVFPVFMTVEYYIINWLVSVSLPGLRTVFSSFLISVSISVLELRLLDRYSSEISKLFSSPVFGNEVRFLNTLLFSSPIKISISGVWNQLVPYQFRSASTECFSWPKCSLSVPVFLVFLAPLVHRLWFDVGFFRERLRFCWWFCKSASGTLVRLLCSCCSPGVNQYLIQ